LISVEKRVEVRLTRRLNPAYRGLTMKILVIGGGGREHALVWKLRQSPTVTKLWCAPGNGGIAQEAECVAADLGDVVGLRSLAQRLGADLAVVGPEQPLVLGIADEFADHRLRLVGPSRACAQLEGSKIFAKDFLRRNSIPTPDIYGVFESADEIRRTLASVRWPVVLKADGLCAGKGVLVAGSRDEASEFIVRTLEAREFGNGGTRLLMEEALTGPELSYIVLSDGHDFVSMVPTRDHKRALDGDQGANTGGMGAYSSDDIISPELDREILRTIVRPTIEALGGSGLVYRGFLYFGLMLTADGPKVLEFNCRLGDPETQALICRVDFDLAEVLAATAEGRLRDAKIAWKPGASICVVMSSGGYPGSFNTGMTISGLEEAAAVPGAVVFHAGTRRNNSCYYTCGGRVLGVSARGANLSEARQIVYAAAARIQFAGAHYRRDIADPVAGLPPTADSVVTRV
jgi:phosphoribosylamine---glycine ligase